MKSQYYGGVIWTNHAKERLTQRGLSQSQAVEAFYHPDTSEQGRQSGSVVYKKRINAALITLIAKQNEKKEWIILSAWIDPPLPGSPDAKEQASYKEYIKAKGLRKFWLGIKRQLGL